jgi:hypothetical protein
VIPGLVFADRDDAEASVKRLQAKRPFRYRWPHGGIYLRGVPTPRRDEVAALWFLRYWQYYELRWDRSPPPDEHETTDFADLPEACLVPVRVVYRAVSDEYLRERGEDRQSWTESAPGPKLGFFVRDHPPGKRLTDQEIAGIFAIFSVYPVAS